MKLSAREALIVGVVLGCLTGKYAADHFYGTGPLIMCVGAVINSLVITLLAEKSEILLSLVPVAACTITLLLLAGKGSTGEVDFATLFFDVFVFIGLWQAFPALATSIITYAIKRRPS